MKKAIALRTLLLILCFFLTGSICSSIEPNGVVTAQNGPAVENTVLSLGTGIIKDGNIARAKEMAINDALRKALERYLIKALGHNILINYFDAIVDEIIPSYRDMVGNFTILTEKNLQDKIDVLAKVRINEEIVDMILKRYGIVQETVGGPLKVLFLVSEVYRDEVSIKCWWCEPDKSDNLYGVELALMEEFQRRRFEPINRLINKPEGEYTDDMLNPELTPELIKKWGNMYLSDIVLSGICRIDKGVGVDISLKALDTNDGSIICQEEIYSPYLEDTENPEFKSIKFAVSQIAERVVPLILRYIKKEKKEISELAISIVGLESLRDLEDFINSMERNLNDFKSIKQIEIKSGHIDFMIEYRGDEAEFLRKIKEPSIFPFELSTKADERGRVIIRIIK